MCGEETGGGGEFIAGSESDGRERKKKRYGTGDVWGPERI